MWAHSFWATSFWAESFWNPATGGAPPVSDNVWIIWIQGD